MNRTLARTGGALGCALALVLGVDYVSMAATGQSLLLGKLNTANTTTKVSNTGAGPALALTVKGSASAPFSTNGKGKVVNLFADRAAVADSAKSAATAGDAKTLNGWAVSDVSTLAMTWGRYDSSTNSYSEPGDVTMSHPLTGVFCIAVAGISHDSGQIVAAPDFDSDTTEVGSLVPQAVVEVNSAAPDCALGEFEVVTLEQLPTDLAAGTDQSIAYFDQGFSFHVLGLPPASVNAANAISPKRRGTTHTLHLKAVK